jgi:hypothetical protein
VLEVIKKKVFSSKIKRKTAKTVKNAMLETEKRAAGKKPGRKTMNSISLASPVKKGNKSNFAPYATSRSLKKTPGSKEK